MTRLEWSRDQAGSPHMSPTTLGAGTGVLPATAAAGSHGSPDVERVLAARRSGELPGRLWLYSNYHCNLACTYCLTASAPDSPRRELGAGTMLALATQAGVLGFTELGVTGGEPFILAGMADLVARMSEHLPVLVLTNATVFSPARLRQLQILAGRDVALQVSLDSAEPRINDAGRGEETFAKVVAAVPRLIDLGVRVRLATTLDPDDPPSPAASQDLDRLRDCLGVPAEDHVIRPVVRRGRAADANLGLSDVSEELPAELTITADGAFWSPFAPTVTGGVLDTDLRLGTTIDPLVVPANQMLDFLAQDRPTAPYRPAADSGDDSRRGIR
ncbi:MAG: radical SAM protein [Acidimicrobiales bacterium]